MIKYNFFLKYLKGNWLLNENLFVFGDKKQQKSEKLVTFISYINLYLYEKKYLKKSKNILGVKYNTSYKQINTYLFFKSLYLSNHEETFFYLKFIRKGLLKIIKLNFKQKIKQEEYIYIVNNNIFISIVLIKNLNNKYLSAKVSSYIRIKKS